MIVKRGKEWCVMTADGSKTIACHPTKDDAVSQLRAIEASKAAEYSHSYAVDKEKYKDLKGVEIFSVGVWNGDKYTEADLDGMVDAYGQVGYTPPLKSGHSKDIPGLPVLGWVENVRRAGTKLLADLTSLPTVVYDAIKNKRYDRVSAEVYFNFKKQDGKILPKALKALALLGSDIPAVKDLKPLHEMFSVIEFDAMADSTHLYQFGWSLCPEDDPNYISKLPDTAFAYVEDGTRMFPHHDVDVTTGTDSETVNMRMLDKAANDVRGSNLDTETMISALSHLRSHAQDLKLTYFSQEEDKDVKGYAAKGIKFVIGKKKGETSTSVQSVVFEKDQWTAEEAKKWLSDNDMHSGKIDTTENSHRFRQADPEGFDSGSFRTIEPGMKKAEDGGTTTILEHITNLYNKEEETEMDEKMKEFLENMEKKFDAVVATVGIKDTEIKSLRDKLTSLASELDVEKTRTQKFGADPDGRKILQLQKELEDTQTRLQSQIQKFSDESKKRAELEEANRKDRIERKVESVKLPFMRPFIEAFYDAATTGENATKIVKFSADENDPKDLTLERVADELVAAVNRLADNKYFTELATVPEYRRDDMGSDEDPGVEVDRRVQEYCAKNNLNAVKDYDKVMNIILNQDPTLKELYAKG